MNVALFTGGAYPSNATPPSKTMRAATIDDLKTIFEANTSRGIPKSNTPKFFIGETKTRGERVSIEAIALDIEDKASKEDNVLKAIQTAFSTYDYLYFTTYSHNPDKHEYRYRVIIPLKDHLKGDDKDGYRLAVIAATHLFHEAGGKGMDMACSNSSQLMNMPAISEENERCFRMDTHHGRTYKPAIRTVARPIDKRLEAVNGNEKKDWYESGVMPPEPEKPDKGKGKKKGDDKPRPTERRHMKSNDEIACYFISRYRGKGQAMITEVLDGIVTDLDEEDRCRDNTGQLWTFTPSNSTFTNSDKLDFKRYDLFEFAARMRYPEDPRPFDRLAEELAGGCIPYIKQLDEPLPIIKGSKDIKEAQERLAAYVEKALTYPVGTYYPQYRQAQKALESMRGDWSAEMYAMAAAAWNIQGGALSASRDRLRDLISTPSKSGGKTAETIKGMYGLSVGELFKLTYFVKLVTAYAKGVEVDPSINVALFLSGEQQTGKTTFARLLVKALNGHTDRKTIVEESTLVEEVAPARFAIPQSCRQIVTLCDDEKSRNFREHFEEFKAYTTRSGGIEIDRKFKQSIHADQSPLLVCTTNEEISNFIRDEDSRRIIGVTFVGSPKLNFSEDPQLLHDIVCDFIRENQHQATDDLHELYDSIPWQRGHRADLFDDIAEAVANSTISPLTAGRCRPAALYRHYQVEFTREITASVFKRFCDKIRREQPEVVSGGKIKPEEFVKACREMAGIDISPEDEPF